MDCKYDCNGCFGIKKAKCDTDCIKCGNPTRTYVTKTETTTTYLDTDGNTLEKSQTIVTYKRHSNLFCEECNDGCSIFENDSH
jgi:hypothetical protein